MDPHPHQPGNSKRSPPPPATEPRQHPKKHKKLRMSGRNQRMAATERMGGDDMKKSFDGPYYRITDQDWKMSDFPDPLLHRPDLSTSLPPGMTRETERGFYAYLQICKDKAREADERKAAEKKAAEKKATK